MGKKQTGPKPKNPVFNLAGGKAAKAKGKTQEVNTRLKKLKKNFNHKDEVEKLDSQMMSLQRNSISFSQISKDKKKIETVQAQEDFPVEQIDEMIDCFKSSNATISTEKKVEEESSK